MQTPSLNISSEAEHLYALLAHWPRRVVAAWLAEHQGNLGSVDIRQVKKPDAGLSDEPPFAPIFRAVSFHLGLNHMNILP